MPVRCDELRAVAADVTDNAVVHAGQVRGEPARWPQSGAEPAAAIAHVVSSGMRCVSGAALSVGGAMQNEG